jgi:hypothetical protein
LDIGKQVAEFKQKTRNMDNNQLFTELNSEDSASIKGGFWK